MRAQTLIGLSLAGSTALLVLGRRRTVIEELDDRAVDETVIPEPAAITSHGRRLCRSTVSAKDTVIESPEELLAQARKVIPSITLDELTAARLAASEHFTGTDTELRAIIDAEVNRAARRKVSLTEHLISAGTYGRQGKRHVNGRKRPASTALDPRERHHRAAVAVLSGESRGIARGAVRFFDPVAQLKAHRKWLRGGSSRRHCHPKAVLDRWSLDLPWLRGCEPDYSRPGKHREEWVGPIPGIDPLRLMLFRPATGRHAMQLEQARSLLADLR